MILRGVGGWVGAVGERERGGSQEITETYMTGLRVMKMIAVELSPAQ